MAQDFKPFNVDFSKFEQERMSVMTDYYLNKLTHDVLFFGEDVEINNNDKLVNKKEIIDLFKKNAEYKLVKENVDGKTYEEMEWVIEPKFKEKYSEKNLDLKERMRVIKYQQQFISNDISLSIYTETKNGISLKDSSAIKLLSEFDRITYSDMSEKNNLKLLIASFSKDFKELQGLQEKIKDENPFIFNYGLLGNLKEMTEALFSNNEAYSRFNKELQSEFVNYFYDKAKNPEKLRLLSTVSVSVKSNENSLLMLDIMKDERFASFDLINIAPELQLNHMNFKRILSHIDENIKNVAKDTFVWDMRVIDKMIIPLTNLIKIGGLDLSYQKKQFGEFFDEFSKDVMNTSHFGYFEKDKIDNVNKDILNRISMIVDDMTFERENKVLSNTLNVLIKASKDQDYADKLFPEIKDFYIREISGLEESERKELSKVLANNKNNFSKSLKDNPSLIEFVKKEESKKTFKNR